MASPGQRRGICGAGPGAFFETVPDDSDIESVTGKSDKDSEEGEISDSETAEQNDEMNYRRIE